MRKHVTPAHPQASIPDLERGDFLPAEGRTVAWNPYWATMQIREEITVTEPAEEAEEAPAEAAAPEAVEAEASPELHPGA